MRTLWGSPLVILALAGCLGGGDDGRPGDLDVHVFENACSQGICIVEGDLHPEADTPEGVTPRLSLDAQAAPWAKELWATPDGWTWIATRPAGDGTVQAMEAYEDGRLRQVVLPSGLQVPSDGTLLHDGVLYVPAGSPLSPDSGLLVTWELATDMVNITAVPEVPYPFRIVDRDDHDLLLVAPGPLADRADALWLHGVAGTRHLNVADALTVTGALSDGIVYRVDRLADRDRLVMVSVVGGSEFVLWQDDAPILGAWANAGRVGFATLAAGKEIGEAELWEVDRRDQSIALVANGWAPRFHGDRIFFETQEPGLNPDVRAIDEAIGEQTVFFLPDDRNAWDTDGEAVWWFDTPRTDHRFEEAPNPTPFSTVLYERR